MQSANSRSSAYVVDLAAANGGKQSNPKKSTLSRYLNGLSLFSPLLGSIGNRYRHGTRRKDLPSRRAVSSYTIAFRTPTKPLQDFANIEVLRTNPPVSLERRRNVPLLDTRSRRIAQLDFRSLL